jgi:hypothetical protein
LDANDSPHIAYTDWSESTVRQFPYYFVMYASWNGSGWNTQKVSNGFAYSFVLDAKGNPHVLYRYSFPYYESSGPTGLMYARWTGSTWTSQTIDPNGAGYGIIVLDSSGYPQVAYTDGTSIKYATSDGSGWHTQIVATYELGTLPFALSFTLDKNDTPHILYSPSSYADYSQTIGIRAINVTLATYQNYSWAVQPITLPPPTGDYGNIVIDSKGYPHFVCTQHRFVSAENMNILNTILYASWNGTSWGTQIVASDISGNFNSLSLVLDLHDYPHILTSTGIYASWTGTKWNIQTGATDFSGNNPCYLAIDSSGNPHISYLTGTHMALTNLTYTTADESMPKATSTPTQGLSPSPSLAPSPSIPEFQMWIAFLLVVILAISSVIVLKLKFKYNKGTH